MLDGGTMAEAVAETMKQETRERHAGRDGQPAASPTRSQQTQ